jgi:hypothetical protein
MIDYCLKNVDENDFNNMMLSIGLCEIVDDTVVPSSCLVLIDRIGPITMPDPSGATTTDSEGNTVPVMITYPDYYTNLRLLLNLTDEQKIILDSHAIDPSQPQYRVWF